MAIGRRNFRHQQCNVQCARCFDDMLLVWTGPSLLTDVAEFVRLCGAVGGPSCAESGQPVTEDGGGVSTGGVQGVTEVRERHDDPASTDIERQRGRRQAVDELAVTASQRQSVAATREEHRRQVAVRPTQRLAVACQSQPQHLSSRVDVLTHPRQQRRKFGLNSGGRPSSRRRGGGEWGRGHPLPNRLGGLEKRRELPQ